MEREVQGVIGMGNTCKPMAVSFQCMTKFTTNKIKLKKKKRLLVERHATDIREGRPEKGPKRDCRVSLKNSKGVQPVVLPDTPDVKASNC